MPHCKHPSAGAGFLALASLSLFGATGVGTTAAHGSAQATATSSPLAQSSGFQIEDGGLKDLSTSLVWSVDTSSSQWNWTAARDLALDSTEGGFDDWILATRNELVDAAVNGIGAHINEPGWLYWSRDTRGSKAWAVRLDDGTSDLELKNVSYLALRPNRYSGPTGLTATAISSSEIDLSWQDNSASEGGFELQSSLEGTTWDVIFELGADVTSFRDSGLSRRTEYFYRVRALRDPGTLDAADPGWASPFSEPVSARTKRR